MLWAARSKYDEKPFPEKFQTILDRGNEIEDIVKAILVSRLEWLVVSNQQEVLITLGSIIELTPVAIVGHMDCVTRTQTGQKFMPTEIKGFGKSFLEKYERTDITAFPMYRAQVSAYCYGYQSTAWRFIVYKKTTPDHAEDSPTRLIIRDYEKPPMSLDELKERVTMIETLYAHEHNPQSVPCVNNYPCKYFYLHDTPEYVELTDKQVAIARAIKTLDDKISALSNLRAKMRTNLQSQLTIIGADKFRGNNVSVSVYDNPDRFNQAMAKAILVEATVPKETYTQKGEGKTMRITVKGEKSSD